MRECVCRGGVCGGSMCVCACTCVCVMWGVCVCRWKERK